MAHDPVRLRLVAAVGPGAPTAPREAGAGLTDAQLVALTMGDDLRAFEALYRRHAPFALNLAIRLQGGATDAEDVVHDAFLKSRSRLAELRDPSAFRAWLGSIVVRLVRTRLRRLRLLRTLGLANTGDSVDLEAVASTEAGPEARAMLAQVYALLGTLPVNDHIAWTLRYVERHRLEAVAELTSASLATVKRRIGRTQTFLAEHFVSPLREARP